MPVYYQITDFGCAKFQIGNTSTVTRRTFQWCAPEVNDKYFISSYFINYKLQLFDASKHSTESDIYAYGVLLWELVTHDEPYKGLSETQIMYKVVVKNEVRMMYET